MSNNETLSLLSPFSRAFSSKEVIDMRGQKIALIYVINIFFSTITTILAMLFIFYVFSNVELEIQRTFLVFNDFINYFLYTDNNGRVVSLKNQLMNIMLTPGSAILFMLTLNILISIFISLICIAPILKRTSHAHIIFKFFILLSAFDGWLSCICLVLFFLEPIALVWLLFNRSLNATQFAEAHTTFMLTIESCILVISILTVFIFSAIIVRKKAKNLISHMINKDETKLLKRISAASTICYVVLVAVIMSIFTIGQSVFTLLNSIG